MTGVDNRITREKRVAMIAPINGRHLFNWHLNPGHLRQLKHGFNFKQQTIVVVLKIKRMPVVHTFYTVVDLYGWQPSGTTFLNSRITASCITIGGSEKKTCTAECKFQCQISTLKFRSANFDDSDVSCLTD
jgi:hypothetical protein